MLIVLTRFARERLFGSTSTRLGWGDCTADTFIQHLNQQPPLQVLPGYAPFCVLHVHANWTQARAQAVPITDANRHALRTAYEARTPAELPVLVRWLEGVEVPRARYLLPILYHREQLAREGDPIEAEWGVVGCLCTLAPEETPLAPITLMRNALGVAEGGSGVALDRATYQRSVAFWEQHANVR